MFRLVKRVKDIGQTAVAMTDHGNIYGTVEFVDEATKTGIKPIVGCELYVCKKDDHRAPPEGDTYNICWYWRKMKRAIAT